jgi:hypothetical protein
MNRRGSSVLEHYRLFAKPGARDRDLVQIIEGEKSGARMGTAPSASRLTFPVSRFPAHALRLTPHA